MTQAVRGPWSDQDLRDFFGAFYPDRDRGLFAMLRAYFDESASQSPSDVFVVAGYLGYAQDWERFTRFWIRALKEYGVDPPVFHATDFEHRFARKNRFSHLSVTRGREMQRRLFKLIRQGVIVGVAEALPRLDFEEMRRERLGPNSKGKFFSAYIPCFARCLAQLERYRNEHYPGEAVTPIFDRGGHGMPRFYGGLQDSLGPAWSESLAIGSCNEMAPLQAADILAYEIMKYAKNELDGRPNEMRTSLRRITTGLKVLGAFRDKRAIRDDFDAVVGLVLRELAGPAQ